MVLIYYTGADSGFEPGGGGRDFLGTFLKLVAYLKKKDQHSRKKYKTHEKSTNSRKKYNTHERNKNSRKRNKTQEKRYKTPGSGGGQLPPLSPLPL